MLVTGAAGFVGRHLLEHRQQRIAVARLALECVPLGDVRRRLIFIIPAMFQELLFM